MAITLKTDKSGLVIIDRARTRKNWSALAAAWCHAANVSLSTLKRFRERKAIQKDSFIAICKAVGIEDWEMIVADSVDDLSMMRQSSQQAKKLIVEEARSKLLCYIVSKLHKYSRPVRWKVQLCPPVCSSGCHTLWT